MDFLRLIFELVVDHGRLDRKTMLAVRLVSRECEAAILSVFLSRKLNAVGLATLDALGRCSRLRPIACDFKLLDLNGFDASRLEDLICPEFRDICEALLLNGACRPSPTEWLYFGFGSNSIQCTQKGLEMVRVASLYSDALLRKTIENMARQYQTSIRHNDFADFVFPGTIRKLQDIGASDMSNAEKWEATDAAYRSARVFGEFRISPIYVRLLLLYQRSRVNGLPFKSPSLLLKYRPSNNDDNILGFKICRIHRCQAHECFYDHRVYTDDRDLYDYDYADDDDNYGCIYSGQ